MTWLHLGSYSPNPGMVGVVLHQLISSCIARVTILLTNLGLAAQLTHLTSLSSLPLHPLVLQPSDGSACPSSVVLAGLSLPKSGQSRRCLPSLIQLQHTSHHSPLSLAPVIGNFLRTLEKWLIGWFSSQLFRLEGRSLPKMYALAVVFRFLREDWYKPYINTRIRVTKTSVTECK